MTDVSPILSVCIANNRMAAAPKVYLADTGILHSLLGIAGEHGFFIGASQMWRIMRGLRAA